MTINPYEPPKVPGEPRKKSQVADQIAVVALLLGVGAVIVVVTLSLIR